MNKHSVAYHIYEYREREGRAGDEQSDWHLAEKFLTLWNDELRRCAFFGNEEEFLEVWCHWWFCGTN